MKTNILDVLIFCLFVHFVFMIFNIHLIDEKNAYFPTYKLNCFDLL